MFNETWKDQYDRLQRSFRRLEAACSPAPKQVDLSDGRDAVYHFCCDAFHLRDWIRKSTSVPQPDRDAVYALIKSSVALSACADIANGFKHLALNQPSYSPGGYAEVTGQGVIVDLGAPGGAITTTWDIDAAGNGKHDALSLAAEAIADWDTWLHGRNLL